MGRVAHSVGSLVGGGISGALIGSVGSLLALSHLRVWVIGVVSVAAVTHAVRRSRFPIARRRQVPREWERRMSPAIVLLLWGMLLGTGFATYTSYAVILLVIGAQLTSPIWLAAALGALLGLSRSLVTLTASFRLSDPVAMMNAVPRFAHVARRLNLLVILVGALALIAGAI